ncbi:choline dehydrogenase [Grosmannia clavigera kw1407]|uniref:Choline dehydrogenase n=1 Tax=Grosmannia clavigera (strain kw1407 / UAMH 11150) TaxID=655863 RepID=F0XAY5_GROCL|nr:choline dehydrogenase [Grosmannia clavigera kw1407]EFX05159.1 choline dehydrogenase [Grosmannia clavigera kw1407]
MTTTFLPHSDVDSFDYVIVGGGTAGCVIASRLAEYLPSKKILMIEAGPSDFMDNRVLDLRQWLSLLGGELDYDYGTTEQPNGNSNIRHSRAKVLGGCSSHNTLISFRPFDFDLKVWQSMGAKGWTFPVFMRSLDKLRNTVQPVHARHRNQLTRDWVSSCSSALDIPVIHDFNHEIESTGRLHEGVGFFSISYNPDNGHRSSASVAYIHPWLRGEEARPNLTVLTEAWVSHVNVSASGDEVTGVDLRLKDGTLRTVRPRIETILTAGAVDTPRLLLLSGIGPREQLQPLGIPVVKHVPGVGENLLDHPETIIMFELSRPVPPNQTTMDSDAGIFLRREPANADTGRRTPANPAGLPDGDIADVMMHCYQIPFTLNTERLGYDVPADGYAFCMTPNIPRPRSRGRLFLTSADPNVKPALDFRYFTDPEGYDAATFVYGIKQARRIAQQEPFRSWIKREVAPGPNVKTDEEISEYARRAAHTVYHPAGTTRMGDDALAVVDERLRFRGLRRLRIADAGVFPSMTTINPMLTVLGVAERCAEMIVEDLGRAEARL